MRYRFSTFARWYGSTNSIDVAHARMLAASTTMHSPYLDWPYLNDESLKWQCPVARALRMQLGLP